MGIREVAIPVEGEPVLAEISVIYDLGTSVWHEVVYHDGKQWCSYHGSSTFNKGEAVKKWKYVCDCRLTIMENLVGKTSPSDEAVSALCADIRNKLSPIKTFLAIHENDALAQLQDGCKNDAEKALADIVKIMKKHGC